MLKWRVWLGAAVLVAIAGGAIFADDIVRLPSVEEPTLAGDAPPVPDDPAPDDAPPPPEATAAEETAVVMDAVACEPACDPKVCWERKLELGLNGTDGNSQAFNFRFGVDTKRKTADDIFSLDLDYSKNTTDSLETAHKAFLEGREEWLFGTSPWTLFVHGTIEYDEFKPFDLRLAGDAGVGYQFIKNDATTLVGRTGPGASHEIGGPDDSVVPELVFGLELEHKLSARQKLKASSEFIPAVDDFHDYRLNNKAAWEILCDPAWNLSLQLAVADRYDSTPNGALPNDVDYSLLLIWGF